MNMPRLPARSVRRILLAMIALLLTSYGLQAQGNAPRLVPAETLFSPIGGFAQVPDGTLSLESSSRAATPLILTDYHTVYERAIALLDEGVRFRSSEVQRLDPSTCDPSTSRNNCGFSVTGLQNSYLDFSDGRLYWRFCADYDEPFVGVAAVSQAIDDPGNTLQIDAYGRCPTWESLSNTQKSRRVANRDLGIGTGAGVPDVRNRLVEAQRAFAVLTTAEPGNLAFAGELLVDDWTLSPDGTLRRGSDGQPDRVRDIGAAGLLAATREIANVHMVFGNEFMVKALRYPFSVTDSASEQIVRQELQLLERALYQFQLANDVLLRALNLRLDGATSVYVGDYFTPREFQLFSTASQRQVETLIEIARREQVLSDDPTQGATLALRRLDQAFADQYLQALALATQSAANVADDPATPDRDERRANFLDNGGWEIMSNLERLVQQAQQVNAGLNPLGYDDGFVPLKPFSELYDLANSLVRFSARPATDRLAANQREFDTNFAALRSHLNSLKFELEKQLVEICGDSPDADGDGLKDFDTCGPRDSDGDGEYDQEPNAGLLAKNYFDLVEAANAIALAQQRIDQIPERIRIEEERAGRVIELTTATGETFSALEVSLGVAQSLKTTSIVATSHAARWYAGVEATLSTSVKKTIKGSANPLACVLGGCNASLEGTLEAKLAATAGIRYEGTHMGTTQTQLQ